MSRIWLPGGAGGADLDVITAGAGDVLSGKVIVDKEGEPLTGTLTLTGTAADSHVLAGQTYYNTDAKTKRTGGMANRGAVSQALNAGGSYTIPAGYHNGAGKVTANSLASQTSANAAAGHILSGKTAWVNGAKVTGNIASLASAKTVSCSGKYMTGNVTVSAVSNLTAANIKKGVTVGGVVGTYEGYASSPLYLFRNGTWSNLQTTGVTTTNGSTKAVVSNGTLIIYPTIFASESGMARLNQTFNLTNYKFIKAKIKTGKTAGRIGIGTAADIKALTSLTKYSGELTVGVAILDVSSVSGNYYIYLTSCHDSNAGNNEITMGGSTSYEELFLTNA